MLSLTDVDSSVITHKLTCLGPSLKVRQGRDPGVYVVSCRRCSTYVLADSSGAPVATPTASAPEPVAAPRKFHCPAHGTPVTWRGTGCRACHHDRTTNRSRRTERRGQASQTNPTDAHPEGN